MKTEDDKLVERFLNASVREIPDAGFSRKVMRRIPNRASRYNRWWEIICTAAFAILFILFNGTNAVWQMLKVVVCRLPEVIQPTPHTIAVIVALAVVGIWHLLQETRIIE